MYRIIWNEEPVGTVNVKKEGLYYRFSCICRPAEKRIYKIYVSDGCTETDLGICVPEGEDFVLNTKIPSKYFQQETFLFRLVPKQGKRILVPIKDGMSFPYLEKLNDSCVKTFNGVRCIVIDQSQDPPDNDPIQEHPHK